MYTICRLVFFFWAIFIGCLQASEYGPNILFEKPYDAESLIGNFSGTFCAGQTDQAYNHAGQVVPFLQNYDKEDFLLSFIDPGHQGSVEKIGTIDFRGALNFQCANLSYYKNIMHHMFLGIGTIIQNLNVDVTGSNLLIAVPLTDEQQGLLKIFESRIPKNINTSGILSAYLETGYNRKFTELKNIDWLQLFLKGAILTPQWVQGGDLNILQFPFTGNLTFGYQVIATVTMNLTKHMNFGVYGTVNSFQSKVMQTPYNAHIVDNQLLIDKKVVAQYTPGSVYNGAFYWELENFSQNFTLTAGLSFMYGTGRKIKPISTDASYSIPVSDLHVSLNSTLQSWSLNALFFEIDYNFLTKDNPQGPCLTLFFNTPISGYHYPKINALGGEFGLMFNYYM